MLHFNRCRYIQFWLSVGAPEIFIFSLSPKIPSRIILSSFTMKMSNAREFRFDFLSAALSLIRLFALIFSLLALSLSHRLSSFSSFPRRFFFFSSVCDYFSFVQFVDKCWLLFFAFISFIGIGQFWDKLHMAALHDALHTCTEQVVCFQPWFDCEW